jgi:hypothetical protein
MLDGNINIWFSIIREDSQSYFIFDMNVFNIMCTWIFLELLVTKLLLFGNNVIDKKNDIHVKNDH